MGGAPSPWPDRAGAATAVAGADEETGAAVAATRAAPAIIGMAELGTAAIGDGGASDTLTDVAPAVAGADGATKVSANTTLSVTVAGPASICFGVVWTVTWLPTITLLASSVSTTVLPASTLANRQYTLVAVAPGTPLTAPGPQTAMPRKVQRHYSAAARRAMAEASKRRWAKHRAEQAQRAKNALSP
jgi:hypothetical protein